MQSKHAVSLAAALLLLATSLSASALTRDEVRSELAMARAQGMLDQPGEAAATDSVLLARELYNETQTREIVARYELERELALARSQPDGELVMVVEADENGQIAYLAMIDFD